ncbi:transglycosylase SLT domain-containing protein [Pseudomonas sp. BT76 TE3572]|uniref:transglycosylase SLT domain-containing protein n=1 Tax=Pseudomonas sp. BT76 TE3572 TaxID=3349325 RepID=UPI003D26024E
MDIAPATLAHPIQAPPPAYGIAARQAGVPSEVLFAVALQESGVTLRGQRLPWPWTLNIAGAAHYFANRTEACLTLVQALKQLPATRIDAGLAQINLGYQKRFYRHPCELLIPHNNLAIAGKILREQYRTGEDWLEAVGRYHRPAGGSLAASYRRRVSKHMNQHTAARSTQP